MDIITATDRGKLKDVGDILDADPSQVHAIGRTGDQALHLAALQGRTKIAELLIERGADVNARGHGGRTPLHYAVESSHKSVVKLLAAKGCR